MLRDVFIQSIPFMDCEDSMEGHFQRRWILVFENYLDENQLNELQAISKRYCIEDVTIALLVINGNELEYAVRSTRLPSHDDVLGITRRWLNTIWYTLNTVVSINGGCAALWHRFVGNELFERDG